MSNEPIYFNNDQDLPTRADAIQNRADILEVARNLFAAEGVENVSMSQIARDANVGKGTLYRHFRNKPDLCIALLDSEQRAFQNRSIEHLRTSIDSPVEKLEWFLENLCDFTERNLAFLYEARAGRLVESAVSLDHPAHHWQWQTIAGLVRQANPLVDADYFADVIYIMLDAENYRFQRYIRQYSPERVIESILDVTHRLLGLGN